MTNIEHLLENALSAVDKAEVNGTDVYEAFLTAMNYDYNKDMLAGVSMTCGELWEVVQYIKYTREMYPNEADMGKKSFPSDDVLKALECCAGFEADVCDKCSMFVICFHSFSISHRNAMLQARCERCGKPLSASTPSGSSR